MKSGNCNLSGLKIVFLVLLTGLFSAVGAQAQEITPEHTAAARKAMVATGATSRLDKILPEAAEFIKAGLIANRPDIESEISTIVDEVALTLAPRRGPLEDEVAKIYTKLFTQAELETIETFFSSEAGEKFLELTPILYGEIDQVSKVWRKGVARDLSTQVQEKLKEAGLQ